MNIISAKQALKTRLLSRGWNHLTGKNAHFPDICEMCFPERKNTLPIDFNSFKKYYLCITQ